MVRKIGILGGTFDPPHLGHEEMARAALLELGLDEVIWIPANKNPLKRRLSTTSRKRMDMVRLAVAHEPRFSVSDIEVSRGGQSFTVDTLEELQMVSPGCQWWLILGADSLKSFMDWKDPDRVVKMARLAVVTRRRDLADSVRRMLPPDIARRTDVVSMRAMDISSTVIRSEIAVGKSVELWLNPAIWEYIQTNGLYMQVKAD